MRKQPAKAREKATPGPRPDALAHSGNWDSAAKNALAKKRPADGWPKPEAAKRAPSGGPKQASRLQPKVKQAKLKNRK